MLRGSTVFWELDLAEDGEQEACRDGGADDARDVRAHGVHEQEVGGVGLLADHLGNTRGHRDGGDAGRADQRVDLLAGQLAHDVAADEAAGRGDAESDEAEEDDLQGLGLQEVRSDHGRTDRGGEEDRDDVHECVLHGVGQTIGAAAFTEQVAEHQAADQRSRGRQEQDDEDGDDDREEDLLGLGDDTRLHHLDLAVRFRGHELHDRGLDHRDQSHVGIRRDGDCAQQMRGELVGQEDGRRAVRAADDADGSGLRAGEAEADGAEEGDEHAQLSRSAEQQALRICDQGAEVGHGADAHEDEGRVQTGLDADVEDIQQACIRQNVAVAVIVGAGGVKERAPELGVVHGVGRVQLGVDRVQAGEVADVRKQAAERDADEQQRLEAFDDAEVQQDAGDDDHDKVLPAAVCEEARKAGFRRQL